MKKLLTLLLIFSCSLLIACSSGQEINGHTLKTAYRSVKALKNRLSPDSRIEFEVSFWTIRDAKKNDEEFLEAVDGKKPQEVIALGKEIYQKRKDEGFQAYSQYSSWEDMIAKFGQERNDQEKRKVKIKEDANDKANDVLYKL
jgi:gas vesicle protein